MAADSRTDSERNAREIEPRKRGRKGRHYTETEIETGLFALAMASGSPSRASEALALQGLNVPATTLDHWRNQIHTLRYERIRDKAYPQVKAKMAEAMEGLFEAQVEVEWQLLKKLEASIEELPARDVSGALRNVGVTKALNVDKSAPLRGEPTARVEVSAVDQAEAALAVLRRKGLLVESKAEEIED
jgi:hypothetical protein